MTDQKMPERVRNLVEVPLAGSGFELVDVEHRDGLLRVTVDRPGGVDLDAVDAASRLVSAVLDEADPLPSPYTLEVSSPGIERALRTPQHFIRFVGSTVSLRTRVEGAFRTIGTLESADESGIVVDGATFGYDQIRSARTVFVWPAAAKAGRP